MDEDGYIYIIGRINGGERFKVCGDVVYAKVIEDIIVTMPGIKNIVVVSREVGSTYGDEISYCVETVKDALVTADEVYKFAEENLPSANEWPIRVFFYERFPIHGARSKVSKKMLTQDVVDKVTADEQAGVIDPSFIPT